MLTINHRIHMLSVTFVYHWLPSKQINILNRRHAVAVNMCYFHFYVNLILQKMHMYWRY